MKEFTEYVQRLYDSSDRYLKALAELKEPSEEDVHFLFESFHSCS
jgi:hypothetical protein